MRILVTGGAGFIGSALVRHLVEEKHHAVLNVDKLTYAGNLASIKSLQGNPLYRFLRVDICDRDAVQKAVNDFRPQWILHLAAESHVDRSVTGSSDFINTNILGTFALLEAARQYWSGLPGDERDVFRFVHVSTDEVYGSLGDEGLFHETSPYDPSSPYSASKAASDHLARAWHRTYGMPVIVTNSSNNYGPYQFPEKLIPLMILNAIHGKPLPIYGNGANVRDWLYVSDHVRALDLIAKKGRIGETYNVGGHNERANIDVVKAVCRGLDSLRPQNAPHERLISFVTDRPGHDARYAIDASKLETELGWQAEETFETGLAKTIQWYLDNKWWWAPLSKTYDGSRLGLLETSKVNGALSSVNGTQLTVNELSFNGVSLNRTSSILDTPCLKANDGPPDSLPSPAPTDLNHHVLQQR